MLPKIKKSQEVDEATRAENASKDKESPENFIANAPPTKGTQTKATQVVSPMEEATTSSLVKPPLEQASRSSKYDTHVVTLSQLIEESSPMAFPTEVLSEQE
ncbi:hypothetical protein GOP47_0012793 [Adiantum capillus-veneris]|uniref:Uncharacterized protein n=1 Tax=Adiantum capillus-veneris TaxID=13818 RepID=A0A9D4USG4_ADICA|nr:hypothetical protein GOP47_0012793 [Adiantum capillus-veneris]